MRRMTAPAIVTRVGADGRCDSSAAEPDVMEPGEGRAEPAGARVRRSERYFLFGKTPDGRPHCIIIAKLRSRELCSILGFGGKCAQPSLRSRD
jgi:hypothetical protein